jgi:hypothetical protein
LEIPYRDGENHVRKGEGSNDLECLDSKWGVEKWDLGNVLGDCLPNWNFPLDEGGNIRQVVQWCSQGIPEAIVL